MSAKGIRDIDVIRTFVLQGTLNFTRYFFKIILSGRIQLAGKLRTGTQQIAGRYFAGTRRNDPVSYTHLRERDNKAGVPRRSQSFSRTASADAIHPDIFVLDEPSSNLDIATIEDLILSLIHI